MEQIQAGKRQRDPACSLAGGSCLFTNAVVLSTTVTEDIKVQVLRVGGI